jgi:hypothetical protein
MHGDPGSASRRRGVLRASVAALAALALAASGAASVAADSTAPPALRRILIATVAAPDLRDFEARYAKWFGYVVRERGRVDPGLAASWGAPAASRRPYILMSADGWPDVYVRAVRTPAVRGYRPMAT